MHLCHDSSKFLQVLAAAILGISSALLLWCEVVWLGIAVARIYREVQAHIERALWVCEFNVPIAK